jgi:putative Holliday junction resolvase
MRTLALDPGERRIGVAITDPTGTISQPFETIRTRGLASPAALERIVEIVSTHGVSQIVIGLPVHMDGREGAGAEAARSFGSAIAAATGVPIDYLDERWSSLEAQRLLREAGERGKRDEGRVDRIAATLLLETYLARST